MQLAPAILFFVLPVPAAVSEVADVVPLARLVPPAVVVTAGTVLAVAVALKYSKNMALRSKVFKASFLPV